MTEALSIGPPQAMTQNTIYSMPACRCILYATGTPTIVASSAVGMSVTTAVSLTNGQVEVAGGFIKCTSGNITVILKKS